ncbi:NEL-type E3 ubiquitin ligase domain-containing protein [Pseudomonas sp. Irchel 3E13]|uniref:NEL-type E3 ubiquitin ligase domain-containing protein n=1 Tax=Pseudomonas sp. Irchel 3E13 TaxID=2008975 RepID=UPI000BA4AC98|nr:NEL-type E3 ubiquitin ligase domain-containing protein [Pseudomonas sp. Irchel 3E13]
MSNPIDSITAPGESPVAGPTHYDVVKSIVPPWLAKAPRDVHRAVRAAGPGAASWFVKAMTDQPQIARLLQQTYVEHRHAEGALTTLLARIPDIEAFAEPLLNAAIQKQFGLHLDARTTWLFHAGRVQVDDSFVAISRDPLVESFKAMRGATQDLLRAALQNFEAWEAEPGGMQQSRLKSSLYAKDATTEQRTSVAIEPEAFAALCRTLDLGGQYQKLIDSVLDNADAGKKHHAFERFETSALMLQAHTAYLKSDIGQTIYHRLLMHVSRIETDAMGTSLRCSFLKMWNTELTGIVIAVECGRQFQRVLGQPDWVRDVCKKAILVYIPDDPFHPLKEYASFKQFQEALQDKLLQPQYLKFFERFVPARHRNEVFGKIRSAFYPKVWNSGGFYEERQDSDARLDLGTRLFSGDLVTGIVKQKIAVLRDDALFHAVPTANEDQKTREGRLRYFVEVGFDVLNVAAFVLPGLGWVMMAVTAAQLAHEVYEGFYSLSQGDREQAWSYLMDVVENLAQIATLGALAGAAAGAGVPALEMPVAVEEMRAVRLGDGRHRLWKPDLHPFAHDIVLPAGLKPNALGLYNHLGKQWLPLDGSTFRVTSNAEGSAHLLEHPDRSNAYQPTLRSNGAGAWLHEVDRPLEWEGLTLFQRLGPLADGLSEQTAHRILFASDTYPAQLRRALADSERPPALLIDALERVRLEKELSSVGSDLSSTGRAALFAAWYDVLQAGVSGEARLLMETFTGLPAAVAEELLAHAEPSELTQLRNEHKVALRLAEEARVYQQKVRLARAYEGLYLDSANTADSDRLMLHSLENLPGWSPEVRLEVRSGAFDGPLLDQVGPSDAPICRVLLKGDEGYQAVSPDGMPAEAPPDDLFAAVLDALPLTQREALGLVSASKMAFRHHLQAQPPIPRQRARQVLQMQPGQPGARSPMRLADGRLGYPLSGRGALAGYISEETLLDKIRQLAFLDAFAEDILRELYSTGLGRAAISERLDQLLDEQRALHHSMTQWWQNLASTSEPGSRARSRERIVEALWTHWRGNNLPEIGRTRQPLWLASISIADFPDQLPQFVYDRVQGLVLRDFTVEGPRLITEPDGLLRYEEMLPQFLQRFGRVRSLEIRHSIGWPVESLPRVVAMSYPHLRRLHLNDLQLSLNQHALQALSDLRELEHLDLSGNLLVDAPLTYVPGLSPNFLGMNLNSLALDRVGMTRWPQWLDRQMLSRISMLSLVDNHLVELPRHILQNEANASHQTRIFLRGNLFSRQEILSARLGEGRGSRFSFDLDIPETVHAELNMHLHGRGLLSEALDMWRETSSSAQPLTEQQIAARQGITETIMDFWRETMQSNYAPLLELNSLELDDFPQRLPVFFYQRVRLMELLRPRGTPEALNRFLLNFPHVERLAISGYEQQMTELPGALRTMQSLTSLALTNLGLRVDQAMMAMLTELPQLASLELDGNRLGTITSVSGFTGREFNLLSLNAMHIETWPAWLDALLPGRVDFLSLDNNLLTELPDYLLDNHRNPYAFTEVSLFNNPLTYDTRRRAYTSIADNRPFLFEMDFPEDVRQLHAESHSSDSDEFVASPAHTHSTGVSSEEEEHSVSYWLTDNVDENEMRRATWQQLDHAGDATDLVQMIGRLRHTADYRSNSTRSELIARVWRVLDATVQDVELRLTLNGMAQEPLRQLRSYDTCPDGIRLEFNQMEIQVFTRQSLLEVPEHQRGPTLYRLTRRLYRLQELDTIAREEAGARDEAEVRLAYRLHWAEELNLPLPPGRMLYRAAASVRQAELGRVLDRVLEGERGQPFLAYAAQRDFWVAYLREVYAERFKALKEAFEAQVLELLDLYPDDEAQRSSERIQVLEAQLQQDERNLIEELTNREGLAGD